MTGLSECANRSSALVRYIDCTKCNVLGTLLIFSPSERL